MMPFNYMEVNEYNGVYQPSSVKIKNSKTFAMWVRFLFERACCVIDFNLPDAWDEESRDYFLYCIYAYGHLAVIDDDRYGKIFQPCSLYGENVWRMPTNAIISNPHIVKTEYEIGNDCQILKLTHDYCGIWDFLYYYAERLSLLDGGVEMAVINSKIAFMLGAKNKSVANALKKAFDKMQGGEPVVVLDIALPDFDNEELMLFDRAQIKNSYIGSELMQNIRDVLDDFDRHIGIPYVKPKKERMLDKEIDTQNQKSACMAREWVKTFNKSALLVNSMFNLNIYAEYAFKSGGDGYGEIDSNRLV